jgi:hypothetical protein
MLLQKWEQAWMEIGLDGDWFVRMKANGMLRSGSDTAFWAWWWII